MKTRYAWLMQTDLSLSAIKMRLYRAIDRLRELAADILGDDPQNE